MVSDAHEELLISSFRSSIQKETKAFFVGYFWIFLRVEVILHIHPVDRRFLLAKTAGRDFVSS